MHISYWNIALQVVNFLVLVALLRRFLYRPMLAIIAKRQAAAAEHQQRADDAERQAKLTAATYEQKLAALAKERQATLAQAQREGEAAAVALREAAERRLRELEQSLGNQLEKERVAALGQIKAQAVQLGTEVARRLLADVGSRGLDQELLESALTALTALTDEKRRQLRLQLARGPVEVVSARPLDEPTTARVRAALAALAEQRDPSAAATFRVDPTLLAGIELRLLYSTWPFHLRESLERASKELLA